MLILEGDVAIMMKEIFSKFYHAISKHKERLIPLILLFAIPSAASFILGYQYSTPQVLHVPVAMVDHDNSSLSRNLVKQIGTNEAFHITNYSENDDDIKSLMDRGKIFVGVIIPKEFSKDLMSGKAPKILTFYDGSQISPVGVAKQKMSEIFGTIKAGYLISLQEGKLGVMPDAAKSNASSIQFTSRLIGNPTKSTREFLVLGGVLSMTQIAIVLFGIIIINEKNYFKLLLKGIVCGLIGSIVILCVLMIQFKYFRFPYRGSVLAMVVLTVLFSIGMTNIGLFFNLKKNDKISATNSALGLVSLTYLLSGSTFPIIAMPDVFSTISKYVPFTYYGVPMRDLCLTDLSFKDILPDVYWLVEFIVFFWIVIFLLLLKEKRKKKQEECKDEVSKVYS